MKREERTLYFSRLHAAVADPRVQAAYMDREKREVSFPAGWEYDIPATKLRKDLQYLAMPPALEFLQMWRRQEMPYVQEFNRDTDDALMRKLGSIDDDWAEAQLVFLAFKYWAEKANLLLRSPYNLRNFKSDLARYAHEGLVDLRGQGQRKEEYKIIRTEDLGGDGSEGHDDRPGGGEEGPGGGKDDDDQEDGDKPPGGGGAPPGGGNDDDEEGPGNSKDDDQEDGHEPHGGDGALPGEGNDDDEERPQSGKDDDQEDGDAPPGDGIDGRNEEGALPARDEEPDGAMSSAHAFPSLPDVHRERKSHLDEQDDGPLPSTENRIVGLAQGGCEQPPSQELASGPRLLLGSGLLNPLFGAPTTSRVVHRCTACNLEFGESKFDVVQLANFKSRGGPLACSICVRIRQALSCTTCKLERDRKDFNSNQLKNFQRRGGRLECLSCKSLRLEGGGPSKRGRKTL